MFMLVGETDRSRAAPSTIARDGAPAFLSETGAGWHYRKDGAHRAPGAKRLGKIVAPASPDPGWSAGRRRGRGLPLPSSVRAVACTIASMDRDYWTKQLREAERELDAATRRSDANAAAKKLRRAKAALKRLEQARPQPPLKTSLHR
jgi:hypothetical protein